MEEKKKEVSERENRCLRPNKRRRLRSTTRDLAKKKNLVEKKALTSAQLMTAPTGRPSDMRNLFPAAPPRPRLDCCWLKRRVGARERKRKREVSACDHRNGRFDCRQRRRRLGSCSSLAWRRELSFLLAVHFRSRQERSQFARRNCSRASDAAESEEQQELFERQRRPGRPSSAAAPAQIACLRRS